MAIKYKIKLKDIKLEYFKEYVSPIFNFLKPKKKIKNIPELQLFIFFLGLKYFKIGEKYSIK